MGISDRSSRSLASRSKPRASRVPIIIIPAAPTSLITMLNATDILQVFHGMCLNISIFKMSSNVALNIMNFRCLRIECYQDTRFIAFPVQYSRTFNLSLPRRKGTRVAGVITNF